MLDDCVNIEYSAIVFVKIKYSTLVWSNGKQNNNKQNVQLMCKGRAQML